MSWQPRAKQFYMPDVFKEQNDPHEHCNGDATVWVLCCCVFWNRASLKTHALFFLHYLYLFILVSLTKLWYVFPFPIPSMFFPFIFPCPLSIFVTSTCSSTQTFCLSLRWFIGESKEHAAGQPLDPWPHVSPISQQFADSQVLQVGI